MELHELHVEQVGADLVRHGGAVTRALPRVRRAPVHPPPAAAGEHHRAGLEGDEASGVAVVPERAAHAIAGREQRGQRVLHAYVDARGVHQLVLTRADQLEAGAVTDVGEALPRVRAERALHDQPVVRAIEDAAPALQLEHAIDDLVRVELDHPPVVEQLAAEHRVGEMHLPAVLGIDIADAGGDAALRHHGVRLAEQRLAHHRHRAARLRRGDRGAHAGAARPDDEDVAFDGVVRLGSRCHRQKTTCGSTIMPARSRWMYTSVMTTLNMLTHAHMGCRWLRIVTQRHAR